MKVRTVHINAIFEKDTCSNPECKRFLEELWLNLREIKEKGWPVCPHCGMKRKHPEFSDY